VYFNAVEVRIDHGKLSIVQTTPQEVGYEPVFIVRFIQTGNFKKGEFLKNNIVNIVSRKYHNQTIKPENIWMLEIASPSHMAKEETVSIPDNKRNLNKARKAKRDYLRKYSSKEEEKLGSSPGVKGRYLMSDVDSVDTVNHHESWFTTQFSAELKNQMIGYTSWANNVALNITSVPRLIADNLEAEDPDLGMADMLSMCLKSWKPFQEDCDLSVQNMFQVVSCVDTKVTSKAFQSTLKLKLKHDRSVKRVCLVNGNRKMHGDPRFAMYQLLEKCRMISIRSPVVAHVMTNESCLACDVHNSEPFQILPSDAIITLWGSPLQKMVSSVLTITSENLTFKYPIMSVKSRHRQMFRRGNHDAATASSTQIGEKRKAPDNDASIQSQMARGILAQDAAPAATLLEGQGA